jgi:hypothetical protein
MTVLTDEQFDALKRAAVSPPITHVWGGWSEELHERVYAPLIAAGLVVQTRVCGGKYPIARSGSPVYEATEAGRELVRRRAS